MITTRRASSWMRAAVLVLVLAACTSTVSPSATASASQRPSASAGPTDGVPSQSVDEPLPFPLDATIPEIQAAMESGDLTAVQLVEFYLARIAAYDDAGPRLNAFIFVNPNARDEAAALDAERAISGPRGPLHGIPIVLKDNMGTVDMPTTAGSAALEGFIPSEDAFQVRRLREAGAIILGKANMYEFANGWTALSSLGGQTLSPYDPSRDPGGSSGGSAVAVTANFAMAGFGTDSCGSTRLPAAHNNLYGLRPTEGLSSRTGLIPLSTTLDTMGPLTRTIGDLAILLDATVGVDPGDPTTVPVTTSYVDALDPNGLSGRRIGLINFTLDREVDLVIQAALAEMEANGVEFVEVTLPTPTDPYRPFDEFGPALAAYLDSQPGAPSLDELKEFYAANPELDVADLKTSAPMLSLDNDRYRAAIAGRALFRDKVVALMDELDLDAIAIPESPHTAPQIGVYGPPPVDCTTTGYGGLPGLVIPTGFTEDGFAVGLDLMGRPFAEATLIAMAAGYEAHTDHRRLPSTTPPL